MLIVGTAIFVLVALVVTFRSSLPKGRAWVTVVAFGLTLPAFALVAPSAGAADVETVLLGTAGNYSVLGATTVTNTGDTVLAGSLGLSPGSDVTGFPPGEVTPPATIDVAGAADQAQLDLDNAYDDAAGRSITATTTSDLADLSLTSGVYAGPNASPLGLTGTLTLDAEGNADAVFIFQTNSTLITGSSSAVALINGAQACNVFWQVGSSATLGTDSVFVGTVLAQASVTVNTNVTVHGRALARTGAVTLDDDVFTDASCAPAETTTSPGSASTTAPSTGVTTSSSTPPTTVAPTTAPGGPTTTSGAGTTVAPTTVPGGPTTTSGAGTTVAPTTVPGGTSTTSGAGTTVVPTTVPGGPTSTSGNATTSNLTSTTLPSSSTAPGETAIPTTSAGDRSTTTVGVVTETSTSGPSGSSRGTHPGGRTSSPGGPTQLAQTGWPTIPLLGVAVLLIAGGFVALMAGRRPNTDA